jgi:hypothetical protein
MKGHAAAFDIDGVSRRAFPCIRHPARLILRSGRAQDASHEGKIE